MIAVTLTSAQRSALECAGLDVEDVEENAEMDALRAAWDGGSALRIAPENLAAVRSAIFDCADGEDEIAEYGARRHKSYPAEVRQARGARTALENLARKVPRS